MSRFGNNNRNDFFKDIYEKTTPVSLNKGADMRRSRNDEVETDSLQPNRRKPLIGPEEEQLQQRERKAVIEPEAGTFKPQTRRPASEPRDDSFKPQTQRPIIRPEPQDESESRFKAQQKELKVPVSKTPANYEKTPQRSGSGSGGPRKVVKPKRKRMSFAAVLLIDLLAAVLVFMFFCQQNNFFVFDVDTGSDVSQTETVSDTIIPSATETVNTEPIATKTTEATAIPTTVATADPNDWRTKFADKFSSDGQVHQQSSNKKWTYQSANISVNITKNTDNGVVYFVTDIYVADMKYFRTSFGGGPNAEGTRAFVDDALKSAGGVVAVNGDYYPVNHGLTIRNGQYIKYSKTSSDELVMYTDGTMKAFSASDFNMKDIKAQAPDKVYQVWAFGPMLLDSNGQPVTKFHSTITGANNPRTALGYYEPGHYCFVTVDGRQQGYSYPGYSMAQLSQLMYKLGCKLAYNLDGGGSTQLAFMGKEINSACSDKRKDFDIVYITDKG